MATTDLQKERKRICRVSAVRYPSSLNINLESIQTKATLFVPKKGVTYNQLNPDASLNLQYVIPSGVIALNDDGDKDLIIASLPLVQRLFDVPGKVSGLEVKVDEDEIAETYESLKVRFLATTFW